MDMTMVDEIDERRCGSATGRESSRGVGEALRGLCGLAAFVGTGPWCCCRVTPEVPGVRNRLLASGAEDAGTAPSSCGGEVRTSRGQAAGYSRSSRKLVLEKSNRSGLGGTQTMAHRVFAFMRGVDGVLRAS